MELNNFPLLSLPTDLIKLIISFYPCIQWFTLSKQLNLLAFQVISPLDHRNRKYPFGALEWAVDHNKILAVASLLRDPRIDPSRNENHAIRLACDGHQEITEMLLKDPRVDPSVYNSLTIQNASYKGHTAIVEMLLKDKRVDPSVYNNYAIRYASRNGHERIVEMLLQDTRVDPSDGDNAAIQYASRSNYRRIVEMLLKDERVDPRAIR
jgi:hypothetical protein